MTDGRAAMASINGEGRRPSHNRRHQELQRRWSCCMETGDVDSWRGRGLATRTGGEGRDRRRGRAARVGVRRRRGRPARVGTGDHRRGQEARRRAPPNGIQLTARGRRELGAIRFFFAWDPAAAWLKSNGSGGTGRNFRPARRCL